MAGVTETISNSILAALVIFGIISVAVIFSIQNNTEISLLQNQNINSTYSQINSSLSNAQSDASNLATSFNQEGNTPNLNSGVFGFIFRSIINGGTVFFQFSLGLLSGVIANIAGAIGIPPIVISVLMVIFTIGLILAINRMIRGFGD